MGYTQPEGFGIAKLDNFPVFDDNTVGVCFHRASYRIVCTRQWLEMPPKQLKAMKEETKMTVMTGNQMTVVFENEW